MATPAKTPKEAIADYKRAIVHAKGKQYAAETEIDHKNGWFRVRHVDGTESRYRRRQILFFTKSLLESDFDSKAYSRAVEERKAAERQKAAQVQVQGQWMHHPISNTQEVSPATLLGALFILAIIGVAIYLYTQSLGSGSSAPKLFETQYKVTLPSGDIVTMRESELVEYNKRMIKERDAAIQELTNELNNASRKLEQDFEKLERYLNNLNNR